MLLGSIMLFLFLSSIIPDNNGPFSNTESVVIDSIKYSKYPAKHGFNSEYVLFSKSGKYYIINNIIRYTDSRYFDEMRFPSTVTIIYRRRWFWLVGVKFVFQIEYNGAPMVDLNQYRKDLGFYMYLIIVLFVYICISSIINLIVWIRNKYNFLRS